MGAFYRTQLRPLLRIKHPQKLPNAALYARCGAEAIRNGMQRSRWRPFGRRSPAPQRYPSQGPRIALPVKIHGDLLDSGLGSLNSSSDLEKLVAAAAHRAGWITMSRAVCQICAKP